jgi:hypothetical protein
MLATNKITHKMNGSEKEKVIIKKVHPIKIHINPALDLFKITPLSPTVYYQKITFCKMKTLNISGGG